ncbi:ABC transporter substrate-binding protein [Desulfatiglans anilini]|uniref:ABC transporter substrate-binding protein n=1 Tax=Desulfatiglans anilini TaxID=90728 RepID=UPI000684F23F|nr:ABC transporter substrate-binding protein [Desulfatiglans anilini]
MENRRFHKGISGVCFGLLIAASFFTFAQRESVAAEPVKIGYAISLSGVYTAIGIDLRDGLNLYMEEIGHQAGGRQIEVLVEDVGSNQVSQAMDIARKLVQKNNIDILAGVVGTGSAYALAEFVQKNNIPLVISNAGADDLTQRKSNPLIVRPAFVNSAGSHPLGVWAYENGYRKAVAMGADYGAGYEHVGGICRTFTQMGGRIVQEIWPPLGTKDYAPYLAKISQEADVVMVFFAGADALRLVKQFAEYGLNRRVALIGKGYLVDDNILPKQGASAKDIVTESHWCYLLDTPENNRFKKSFMDKYGHRPTLYAEQGYLTGMLIAEALNKTNGEIKGAEFVRVMRSLELKAPRGTVRFDDYGATIQNSYIRKVEEMDGAWESVPIKTFPMVNQFWNWKAEDYMKMTPYSEMKGKWAQ